MATRRKRNMLAQEEDLWHWAENRSRELAAIPPPSIRVQETLADQLPVLESPPSAGLRKAFSWCRELIGKSDP